MEFKDLLIVMVVVWTAGKFFKSLGLPMVFGELIGGIIVGPALLGLVSPDNHTLHVLSELGIFFLMLHAGLHTDPKELVKVSGKASVVAAGGLLLPFSLGLLVCIYLGYNLATSLFIATSVSVSAIAIAVRVLSDCGLRDSKVCKIVHVASLIDDIAALILFSLILSYWDTGVFDIGQLLSLLVIVVLFFGIVLIGGLKYGHSLKRFIYFGNKGFTFTLIFALSMGLLAELVGLHSIIGAFLAGLFISEKVIDERTFNKIEDRVYGLSYSFFGPIFFAMVAFHLDPAFFTAAPLFTILLIAVALFGKVVGCGMSALLSGLSRKDSVLIGLSMNNRGAVEFIVLAIGLEKGIIDGTIFSALVCMTFITTFISIVATNYITKRK